MSEENISGAWRHLCDNVYVERQEHGEAYVMSRWSLSKSRLDEFCKFSKLCRKCYEAGIPEPRSPDTVKPILRLAQKRWLDTWNMCYQRGADTAQSIEALFDHVGIIKRRKPPQRVIEKNRVQRAMNALAKIEDPEGFVKRNGEAALGKDFGTGFYNAVEIEQGRMNYDGD